MCCGQCLVHADQPGLPLGLANVEMGVNFSDIGMPMVLHVKLWATQKPRQEHGLFDARMRETVPTPMHDLEWCPSRILFDNIIERLNQTSDAVASAKALIGRIRVDNARLSLNCYQ